MDAHVLYNGIALAIVAGVVAMFVGARLRARRRMVKSGCAAGCGTCGGTEPGCGRTAQVPGDPADRSPEVTRVAMVKLDPGKR
jgi:hypothetical protein